MSYNTDEVLLSSPDPLNDSTIFSSPAKGNTAKCRRSLPLQGGSPRKQIFQLDVGDRLSPQKIRVTVEAENSERNRNSGRGRSSDRNPPSLTLHRVPAVRQNIRTTTTTVRVKGLSDSEDDSFDSTSKKPAGGRGRPRKSAGAPILENSRNRAVTPSAKPSPRRRKTLGCLVDGDDPEDWDFAIGAGVEVSRGKGRSRSGSISVKGRTPNTSTRVEKSTISPDNVISSTSKGGRSRRKTLAPEEIIIHDDGTDLILNVDLNGSDQKHDTDGVLALRDMNLVPTSSASLALDLIEPLGDQYSDVQVNKFSPANKSSTKEGCSIARSDSAEIELSTGSSVGIYAGTAKSSVKSLQPVPESGRRDFEVPETSQEHQSEMDEMQEFDTILESEGFSMISVDSVPSLCEHLSSPFGPNQNGVEKEPSVDVADVHSLKNDNTAYDEDSFSSIAPEILEAATPRKKASKTLLRTVLSANILKDEDSFSSIPPEILEAASPQKQNINNKVLSVKLQDDKINKDSFSSISPTILEAATSTEHIQPNDALEAVPKLAIISSFQSLETGKQSLTSSGLLTPNETPSPTETASQHSEMPGHHNGEALSELEPCSLFPEESAIENSQIRSSPPSVAPRRFTYEAHARQSSLLHANHLETPSIAFSSPTLPPLVQPMLVHKSTTSSKLNPNQPLRQSLSPIIRAGRVLQDIAVKSTSANRSQGLGSPFKSPATQRNTSLAVVDCLGTSGANERSQRSLGKWDGKKADLFVGFSDDTRRELRKSMIIGEELAQSHKDVISLNPTISAHEEDPFHSGNLSVRLRFHNEREKYTLELPSQKFGTLAGVVKEEHQYSSSVSSESAMSWQAESTIPVQPSSAGASNKEKTKNFDTTEVIQQRREAEWAHERAIVSSQIESASPSKVIVIEPDSEQESVSLDDDLDEGGEEDIWQAEARHSSSMMGEQSQKAPSRQEQLEKPRRSKIPSPWRKNNEQLVYSDELSQLSSQHPGEVSPGAEVKAGRKPAKITIQKRVTPHNIIEDEDELPESSIVWHIPQKSNFTPRPRSSGNLDLSALLASSPLKRPQHAQSNTGTSVPNMPRENNLQHLNTELRVPSANKFPEIDSRSSYEEPQSADDILYTESTVNSTNTSREDSELTSEPSYLDFGVRYPTLPNATVLSPQKSCLRTPTSNSPTKSVAFLSPCPSPQSAPTLSSTTWSKAHWKSLHGIYDSKKSSIAPQTNMNLENDNEPNRETYNGAVEPSKYLGKMIKAQGNKLTLEQWHLDIVQEFSEKVPGWDEGVIAKRLFAVIVGEDLRKQRKD